MKATEVDKIFDDGEEDIVPLLDLATTHRPRVKIPNAATCKAIVELKACKGKRSANVDELMAELKADDDDAEDLYLTEQRLIKYRAGKTESIPLEEVMKRYGLES